MDTFSKITTCFLLIGLVPALISADLPLDSLETHFLSELRFNLRHEPTLIEQCAKYWKGIDDKLKNIVSAPTDEKDLLDRADVDLLMRVSSTLKNRPGGTRSLSDYVDSCVRTIVKYRLDQNTKSKPDTSSPKASVNVDGETDKQSNSAETSELQKTTEELAELRKLADQVNLEMAGCKEKSAYLESELGHCKSELAERENLSEANNEQVSRNQQSSAVPSEERIKQLEMELAALKNQLAEKEKLYKSEIRRASFLSQNCSTELKSKRNEIDVLTDKLDQCAKNLKARS